MIGMICSPTPVKPVIAKVAVYRLIFANMARREEPLSRLARRNARTPHKNPIAPKVMAATGPPRVPALNPTSDVPATAAIAGIRGKAELRPRTGWGRWRTADVASSMISFDD
jgi:hypothetical protein